VVVIADDLGAWLVGRLADAGSKKLIALVLGSDQERALRKAAADAVQDTAAEMNLSAEQAKQFAAVVRKAFRKPVQDAAGAGPVTVLEVLQAAIEGPLAVLDDAGPNGSADVLGMPAAVLAEKLTGHLVRQIVLGGSAGGPLAPLADQLNHDLTHQQGQRIEGMLARLVALGATAPPAGAGNPARAAGPAEGAVQVSDADPRRLGVHAAIAVAGAPEEVPPEYVPRDVDTAEHGVRARVAAAAQRGGFVLLVGGSSVGKTRCAAEAVKVLLPDWWLVHPDGPGQVAALAQAPSPRMVVWLDELQRYLDGEQGVTGGLVRALLNAAGPVVIIGTLWPDWYASYTTLPDSRGPDPHAREREVLDLADVVRIGPEFSPAEQGRARAAAARDPRLRAALESAGYGLTQTLAAAPQLIARWEDAQAVSPYAWAVLAAALDVARLGTRAPLSPGMLQAAAPGYCTPRQQAEAPPAWFEQALAYGTAKLHGAAAALAPTATGMGQIDGYTVADYLLQHARRERRAVRVPASTWDAVLTHIRDPADASRLADEAEGRLLYSYAIPLYRRAAAAGDGNAAGKVADLLAKRGDLDEAEQLLRPHADAGDKNAAKRLDELLANRGELDELRARADAGDVDAGVITARLLAERENLDELRTRADTGDQHAAEKLDDLLAKREDLGELRTRADTGDQYAVGKLGYLLIEREDLDEAEQFLRPHADAGDWYAARRLADLLAERGELDELRARADAGDHYAAEHLADLVAGRGYLDRLRARAGEGDYDAAFELSWTLARQGDLDEAEQLLRPHVDAGNPAAYFALANVLAQRGDLDQLRAHADAHPRGRHANNRLADLLAERGDLDEAEQILRARADEGDGDAGRLAELLIQKGHSEEAEQLRRFGLNPDGSTASAPP
jgi:hypothetical protein